jgi:nucleotide-binding universal stress UspA family protein/pimeloyl-ACP methyl ester carboxylesterase
MSSAPAIVSPAPRTEHESVEVAEAPPWRPALAASAGSFQLAYQEIRGSGLGIVNPLSFGASLAGLERTHGQRGFLEALAAGHQLVWYDQRGAGSSDGTPESWEQRAADLWDVADAAGIERAVLYGVFDAGVTVAHAALQRPDRVLGLIFNRVPASFCAATGDASGVPAAAVSSWFGTGGAAVAMARYGIVGADAETLACAWDEAAAARAAEVAPTRRATMAGQCVGADSSARLLRDADLRPLLGQIAVPALVIAPKRRTQMAAWGAAVAAALPCGRLVQTENAGEALGALHGFLSLLAADVGRQASRLPSTLSATMSDSQRSVRALRRIVVPIDPNVSSGRAVELACRLGEAQKAEILLVHVIAVPHRLPIDQPLPEATFRGGRALRLGEAIVLDHGLPFRSELLRERSAAGGVVRLARDVQADLIVMGAGDSETHEEGRLGRTAEEILRRAPCEVLIDRGAVGVAGAGGAR